MTTLNAGRKRPTAPGMNDSMSGARTSALYCMIALFDMPWSCAFARFVEAMIASSDARGSATLVASDARIAPTALPPPGSSFGRTFTGTIATSGLSGSASCSPRKRRRAAPQIASTTSFTVPPADAAMRFTRSIETCCVAKRRLREIRWLSTDFGAWSGSARPGAPPRIECATLTSARPMSFATPT